MIDVSILRCASPDRIRQIPLFGGEATLSVLYCGRDEMKRIRDIAAELMKQGIKSEEAYNMAYGRVSLLAWEGFSDGNKPFEHNQDNVDLLMTGAPEVVTAVVAAACSLKAGTEKN